MSSSANNKPDQANTPGAASTAAAATPREAEALCQQHHEAEEIRNILSATTAHLELSTVLQEALRGTLRLTGLEGGTLCLVNFEQHSLELAASMNVSPETVTDLTTNRIKIGDCLCGQCAIDCQPLILWDNASGSVFATREASRNEGIRFHAAFPLRARERCIGVLCLFAKSDAKPAPRSLELVQELCGPIAMAIENTRLFEAANRELAERKRAEASLRRTNRTLQMISQCNQVLVRATDEAGLLREVCRIVVEDGGYRLAWVGFAEADPARTVRPVGSAGFEEGYLETLRIVWADTERGRGPAGAAIRAGQPVVIQNAFTDPRFTPWRAEALKRGFASCIGCPLLDGGHPFGVLTIYSSAPDAFDSTEVTLLTSLADDLAFGILALRARARNQEAEQALRTREHLLAESQRIAHIGTWSMQMGSGLVQWTDETYRIYGVDPQTFVPTIDSLLALIHPEDRQAMVHWIQGCTAEKRPEALEFRICRPDGQIRTLSGQGDLQYGPDHTPVCAVGTVQDITERKRAEAALQHSQALLNESQAIAHLGSWELDLSTNCLTWSDEVYRIFGLQPREFGATYEAFLDSVHPDDRTAVTAAYAGSVREGQDTYQIEHRVVKRDTGEIRTVLEKCIHIKDAAGKIMRSIGMVHDITEQKQAETELKQHRERLEELVAARTAELQAANRELEAFSYSVSHDLRAPLRAIHGYSQILRQRFASPLAPEGQQMLGEIGHQAGVMSQLIDDLLKFSRLGRQAMQSEPVDVNAVAQEALAEQSAANPKAQVKLHPLPPAFGDRAMLRVVLNNLLSNAFKYSRNRSPALIEIGGSTQGAQNIYFVKDNGAGFDMKYADKLFGVFQRLHSKEQFEGTGVGLALVQRIILRHGGRIWAEAKVEEGATFFFSLPAPKSGG